MRVRVRVRVGVRVRPRHRLVEEEGDDERAQRELILPHLGEALEARDERLARDLVRVRVKVGIRVKVRVRVRVRARARVRIRVRVSGSLATIASSAGPGIAKIGQSAPR